jgi:hypothetical protein
MRTTAWRALPSWGPRAEIRATYGFHLIGGNRLPHFSVTADIRDNPRQNENNWSGGCCHKEVVKAIPKLAKAIRWHLADSDGVPSHYVANGEYWYELANGFSKWEPRAGQDAAAILRSTIVFGALPDDDPALLKGGSMDIDYFRSWLRRRQPRLLAAMHADLDPLGVEWIAGHSETVTLETKPNGLPRLIRHDWHYPNGEVYQGDGKRRTA